MRVLVTCVPQTGHIQPVLPLAEAFAAAGDDVLVASGPDAGPSVSARGLAFRAVGPAYSEWYTRLVARTRGAPGDGLAPDRVERYFLPRLFGEIGTAVMVDDLLDAARDHRPDLVVFDPLLYAGPLVAAVLGVAGVQHTIGLLTDRAVTDLVADAVSPTWREFGLDVPPHAGVYDGATVVVCPPSLDPASSALTDAFALRPTPLPASVPRPEEVPREVWERPVVYVTLGTFSNSNLAIFRLLLDAVADLPVGVLATVGRDNDPAAFGPTPANVHLARFIPQAQVLPHCAAAVSHVGAGTAFGILAHGLPSVAVPQSADNFAIAGRLRDAGAAHVLMPGEVTHEAVRDATDRALTDGGMRSAAVRLAAEIAAMPAPADVVTSLHSWVG